MRWGSASKIWGSVLFGMSKDGGGQFKITAEPFTVNLEEIREKVGKMVISAKIASPTFFCVSGGGRNKLR